MQIDKGKLKLILSILYSLIVSLSIYLVSLLSDSDVEKFLKVIHNKKQLTISLIIGLSLLFVIVYKTYFGTPNKDGKDDDGQLSEEKKELLKNLTPKEASILMLFLQQKTKVIKIEYETVRTLLYSRVLRCQNFREEFSKQDIEIHEWAWEWINKNEDKLKAKLEEK